MDKVQLDNLRAKYVDFRGPWMNVNPAEINLLFDHLDMLEKEIVQLRTALHEIAAFETTEIGYNEDFAKAAALDCAQELARAVLEGEQ